MEFLDKYSVTAAIVVGGAILLIIVLMFKANLRGLIDRLWAQPDKGPVVPQTADTASSSVPALLVPSSKEAGRIAEMLYTELSGRPVTAEEKLKAATLLAAHHLLRWEFESRLRVIYGSQIEALSALRQKGPHALQEYYARFLERVEPRKVEVALADIPTDFEHWVGFLSNIPYPYLVLNGGIATITDRGDAFMEFLAAAQQRDYLL